MRRHLIKYFKIKDKLSAWSQDSIFQNNSILNKTDSIFSLKARVISFSNLITLQKLENKSVYCDNGSLILQLDLTNRLQCPLRHYVDMPMSWP